MDDKKLKQDADRLRLLYEQRVPTDMSQAKFGETYGIGSQGMVWQYLNGRAPLNYEAAAKFARGLRCTIADINPELAKRAWAEIVPVLGKVSVKAALALVIAGPLALIPPNVEAAFAFNINRIHIAFRRWLSYLRFHRA